MKMRRCERRCEDEKMRYRPPLWEEPCAQTLSGKKRSQWSGYKLSHTEKLRFYLCRSNFFARNEGRSSKTEEKLRFYLSESNPFARNQGRSAKTEEKLRFYLCRSNPFARNESRSAKTAVKVRFYYCRTCLCVKASVCKSPCV